MRKTFLAVGAVILTSAFAQADSWSFGAATGPFIFGRFAERTNPLITGTGMGATTTRLSAATRPGAAVDIERDLADRWAVRVEATWARAPLKIKSASGNQGVTLDAGTVNVTTLVVPVIFRINPRGALRFELLGGPAYALYNVHRRVGGGVTSPLFEGTRGRWGGAAGAGAAWWWSPHFAVEGRLQDIVTSSPLRRNDITASGQGVHIPKPQNGHTSVGIRYRF
ncbi:MAG TPA: hypothetical protein VER58_18185 [Thermoanaerobaculia bacterium]|nr:hypothetical protein [Thermoanaerobaculia bacterium]